MKSAIASAASHASNCDHEVSIAALPPPPHSSISAECRICQEEDVIQSLDKPCACSGSIEYAHRACVQRWCNEKGNTICEICKQPYKNGYTATSLISTADDFTIDFSDEWGALEFQDAQLLAIQQQFLDDAQYEEVDNSSVACCRSIALILVALLLLRHGIMMTSVDASKQEDDASMFITLFVLRAVGFVLPCYIMVRALNMLQRSRHRQDETIAGVVAFVLQAGPPRRYNMYLNNHHIIESQQSTGSFSSH